MLEISFLYDNAIDVGAENLEKKGYCPCHCSGIVYNTSWLCGNFFFIMILCLFESFYLGYFGWLKFYYFQGLGFIFNWSFC